MSIKLVSLTLLKDWALQDCFKFRRQFSVKILIWVAYTEILPTSLLGALSLNGLIVAKTCGEVAILNG